MRVSTNTILFASLAGGVLALGASLTACYNPEPKSGAFLCDVDAGTGCPSGLTCNGSGVCVTPGAIGDMTLTILDIAMPPDMSKAVRTCDQRIAAGAFSNFTELKSLNTTGDESHLAFDPTGQRLLFQRGSSVFASSVASGYLTPAAPTAVTITGAGTTMNGGSFTTDGHYWFSSTSGTSTSLYDGAPSSGAFTATMHTPTSSGCAFYDPAFVANTSAPLDMSGQSDLFVAYGINGCTSTNGQYIARGASGLAMSAFYSALPTSGWQSPSFSPTGLTLLVASTATTSTKPQLYTGLRSGTDYQFTGAVPLDMSAIGGSSTEDRQMVVTDDCLAAYFISVRTGGTGGADIWAAEIASK